MSGGGWIVPTNVNGRKANTKELWLIKAYQQLRLHIAAIEIETETYTDEDENKAFDKAIVLLKVGAKLIKKILKDRGFRELKPDELREAA